MARKISVQIVGDASSLERAFRRASGSSSGFSRDMKRVGVGVAAAGAALVVAGVKAAKFGAEFQDTMQRIVGLSGVGQKQVNSFSKEVLALAPTVGKGPQELAKALYFITSSGISASHAMEVLTASAKASVAGLGDTATVADAVTSAMNAYGAANLDAQQATDVLVATVREGKGEAAAFAGVIGNVASLASQLGVSFNDVGAALAAQTRLGTDAETSSVQLQQVFSNLVKVAPQAEKAFKSVGLSSGGLRAELGTKGLLATLETIKTAFDGNLPALAKAFPNIRALRGVLALVGNQSDETAKIFGRMKDSTGSLKTAFDAVSGDTAQQFRKMRAAAEVAGIRIGAALAPVAGIVANALGSAADALSTFIENVATATSVHAKLDVVFDAAKSVTTKAQSALGAAIAAVDWNAVWSQSKGVADGLQKRLEAIDWSKVGSAIGEGIATGIAGAAKATKEIAVRLTAAFDTIDWVKLGKSAGPGLAAALVTAFTTLMDPMFWIKNWDLALAVAIAAFKPAKLGAIGAKLAAPLARIGERFGLELAVAISGAVQRLGGVIAKSGSGIVRAGGRLIERFGNVVLEGLLKIPGRIAGVFGRLLVPFEKIAKRFGRPLTFLFKVLGIKVAIDAVASGISAIAGFISHGLDAAWKFLEKTAIEAALKIIEPFTHLPGFLGGGPFQDMKAGLQATLAQMQADGADGGTAVGKAVTDAMTDAVTVGATGFSAAAEDAAKAASGKAKTAAHVVLDAAPVTAKTTKAVPPPKAPKGITAAQRNTFFDNDISRLLDRAQDGALKAQLGKLQNIAALLVQRIAKTKDITRKLHLEDQLLGVIRQEKGIRSQLAQGVVDALQFGVTKAEAAAGFKDDLVALNALQAGIEARIKVEGKTAELLQDEFDVQQRIAQKRIDARNAAQFKALGLTATGEEKAPGLKHVRASVGALAAAVKGTSLDTPALQSKMATWRKILAGGFGKISAEVRSTVQGMVDDVNAKLGNLKGPLTKTSGLDSKKLVAGLGLDPATIRELRGRVSRVNSAGLQLAGASPGGGGFVGGRPIIVESHTTVQLDGHTLGKVVTRGQQKTKRRNPPQRRGPNRGD